MRRRLSRRDLTNLYTTALDMRDEARRELADSRFTCSSQASEITRLREQLDARPIEPTTVTALREELDAQRRVNQRLANQLLDAVGHNAEALTANQRRILGLPAGGAR
ncbi:hypothetical protein [Streptomyces sp.]|uniref:hypothetical protein n=1 Tax=Streptomyces sp. TaxID=1931 RepID=UPI002F951D8D